MKIAVDFDGTVVAHRYPSIGKDIGAVPVLKELTEKGHRIILNTMRCKNELEAAKEWFKENEVPLYSANHCPGQHTWTSSPKVFADLYIDDMSLGRTLIEDSEEPKPYGDWTEVRRLLQEGGVL